MMNKINLCRLTKVDLLEMPRTLADFQGVTASPATPTLRSGGDDDRFNGGGNRNQICVRCPMHDLTLSQLHTLQDLAAEKAFREASYSNIDDARVLTGLGLAERSRQGWNITAMGRAELALRGGPPSEAPEA
jgi:hypothetical protein